MSEPTPGAQAVLVAIDFTPAEVRLALAQVNGELILRETYPLPPLADEAAWAWEIGGRVSTLFAHEGQKRWAVGIAVACPGDVDEATGKMTRCPGRPEWDGLAVVDALRRHIDAPIVALDRTHAALRGESEHGAATDAADAIYVSLAGTPAAAVKTSGRIVSGARGGAGTLPDFPVLDPDAPLEEETVEEIAGLLSDLAAFLDPAVLILEGTDAHLETLVPAVQRAVNAVAPGPKVVAGAIGENAALLGALGAAAIVAYEGERSA
ncbi:MAG: ROK family protein [Dehalococcoidia bacterium]